MKKSHKIYAIVASFFVMLIMAITESIRGILIPTFKLDFNITNTQIGRFLFVSTLAYIVGTYFAGKVSRVMNQKQLSIMGMIISGLGFFGTSFAQTYIHLVLGYVVLTIGIGFVVLGLNTIVPAIKVVYISVVINMLHFFYGLGATLTQRVAGYMISHGVNWRHIFLGFTVLYVIAIIVYSFVEMPKREITSRHLEMIHEYEKPLILMFCLGLGFYIAAEIQTANWLLNYLSEMYDYDADQASKYVALFFGMLAIGRLFGGYLLEKIGYLKGITICLFIALVTYSIGLVNESTLLLLSLSGIFFSIVYPTAMLVIQKVFEHNAMRVVSIVSMVASLVNMISGYFVGYLNDNIGVRLSYFSIPISLAIALSLFIAIGFEMKRVEHKRTELEGVVV
ncbi:MAG: MFS transporter [Clostridiales bacterium]|nr:MFS transporter [Clostridiales bacterium]